MLSSRISQLDFCQVEKCSVSVNPPPTEGKLVDPYSLAIRA